MNLGLCRYGLLEVPPRLSLRDVWMEINGTLADALDFVVDSGGELYLWSYGMSRDEQEGTFDCVNMTVRSDGKLEMLTVDDGNEMTLKLTTMIVNAGGYVRTNQLHLVAENMTIDVAGEFNTTALQGIKTQYASYITSRCVVLAYLMSELLSRQLLSSKVEMMYPHCTLQAHTLFYLRQHLNCQADDQCYPR